MFNLNVKLPIKVQNGGLFISRGIGSHPKRKLDSWELIFIEKGKLRIQEENTQFEISMGESLLLWPQRWHKGIGIFPPDLKFYWLHFEFQHNKAIDEPLSKQTISLPQHRKVSNPQYVISLFRQFLAEQENVTHQYINDQNNTSRNLSLEFILLLILQQITEDNHENTKNTSLGTVLAWKARQLILTQYHLNISTSGLAQQLHCNADYLGRVYHKTFQTTITEAIRHQRLRKVQKLLLVNRCSIYEIAIQCGFNDTGYFRQIFRKKTGITPLEWRQRYCVEHVNSD